MPEERKLVTVLFADVTGSTAMGEDLDPEDVRALMGRYYEHARDVVSAHGGTLEKFIGDAVMAVFGLPAAHGDDAERALGAALALRGAIAEDTLLSGLQIRIGVNTGEVVAASDSGRGDFLVTGDAVNVAARLQQAALPGEVLAGHRVYEASRAAFLFGEARDLEVKGKREPLRVYPLAGTRAARQTVRPPLVGREEDLMLLSLLQRRVLREGRPQLVSIVAPAGTGKTRLLEEFLAGVGSNGFRIATGRCLPYGQTLTYWPLRGLLEDLLGIGYTPAAVEDAFRESGHTHEDAARLAGMVLATVGAGPQEAGEGSREREAVFNAWQLLLEALARGAPRIVVFEDLHWGADSLLDLVEHIMSPRTAAPMLVIVTGRPELLDRRRGWGGGRQSFTALGLSALEAGEARALVDALAPSLAEPVRRHIAERSGGNPFFTVELARIAAEHAGANRVGLDALPDTVHAAVLARIDLLEADERAALQAASVIGRAFRPALLGSVLDGEVSDIDAALDGLLARDLIVPGEEAGSFTFRHILIRDVAYGTLSRAQRVRMHAGVAHYLEETEAERLDAFVELIAHHYREAVLLERRAAAPPVRPIEPSRAQYFLERAGELAGRAGAFAEARSHMLGTIEIAPEEEHPRLYEKLGDLVSFGDWTIEAYGKALESWRRDPAAEPVVGARLLGKLLITYMRWQGSITSRLEEAEMNAMLSEARTLAEAAGSEAEIWRVRTAELFWPFWRGQIAPEEIERGTRLGAAAAAYFEGREEWEQAHMALDGYQAILTLAGDLEGATDLSRRRLALPGGTVFDVADAANMLAEGLLYLGRYEEGIELILDRWEARRPGDPGAVLGTGVAAASMCACISGRWKVMDRLGEMLWRIWEELQQEAAPGFLRPGFLSLYHVALAREDRAASDLAAAALDRLLSPAHRRWMQSVFQAYRTDDPSSVDFTPRGRALLARDIPFGLMFCSDRGLPLSPDVLAALEERRPQQMDALNHCLDIARALIAGNTESLAEAIAAAEGHGLVPHAARMRIVLAQMTGDPAPLVQARPVLERLQDRQFLHRLEEVAAAL